MRLSLGAGFASILVIVLLGCNTDSAEPEPPAPLQITSVSPGRNAAGSEIGAAIAVVFSAAIDPATLTASTFRVKRDGTALAGAVSYDAATRSARFSAPLLPGTRYEVEVTTGVRSAAGATLAASDAWNFTTRGVQPVTVDAGPNVGLLSSLAQDAGGRLHMSYAYSDGTDSNLKYATCAAQCSTAASWQTVIVQSSNQVGEFSSLAVDGTGRIHVAYADFTSGDTRYATCAANCSTAASWQLASIDAVRDGAYASLTVDGSSRVHVSYFDFTNGDLRYATCATSCANAASWQSATVDAPGTVGRWTSLAVQSGRIHISYYDQSSADLKYATCAVDCLVTASWQRVTVDATGTVGEQNSLEVDASGTIHVSYWDASNRDLEYATCSSNCSSAASWQRATVDDGVFTGETSALLLDGSGRLHISYFDRGAGSLRYATCAVNCVTPANWAFGTLDTGFVGETSSLLLDASGRLRVSYWDNGNNRLKYIE